MAVEEALCFGCIDCQPHSLDEGHFKLRLTPPQESSRLVDQQQGPGDASIATGAHGCAGLVKVRTAKKDGSWGLVDAIDRLEIPKGLRQALTEDRAAKKNFEKLSISSKKMILYWIASARRLETRRKRVEAAMRHATENELSSLLRPKTRSEG